MTIVEELKALYVKTGGTAATVAGLETVSEVLAAYTALVDGAGSVIGAGAVGTTELADGAVTGAKIAAGTIAESNLVEAVATKLNATELPAVTAADNGSVLTVVNGAWATVAPESAQQ